GGVLATAEKEADFTATATGTEIRLANEGKEPYRAPLKGKFSYVMELYDNQFMHFLMTKEWADANGIKSWADIAKKKPKMRLAINRPDNPQTTIGGPYEVMKAYGFSINDVEKWGGSFVLGNSQIGLDAITAGKADVFGFLREGSRHRPGGFWPILIRAGSVVAALYVLWIGALSTIIGTAALDLGLTAFGSWARAFTAYFHLDISIFIAITFPIAFVTTTANPRRQRLAWTDIVLAAASFAVAMYYVVYNDRFLNWSRGFSQPDTADVVVGMTLIALVIELCRRSVGWGLTSLVLLLLVFTVFGNWMPGALHH